MGFKRTSEGRVFFQGTEEGGSAAKKAEFRSLPQSQAGAAPPQQQATQFQILTLLKALNEKLKDSQGERAKMRAELDAYRKHIEELEGKIGKGAAGKAERAEKLAEDTFKELKETRKMILEIEDKADKADKGMLTLQRQIIQSKTLGEELAKQQTSVEALAKRLDESDSKHEDLTIRIEKTSAEQSRILRQIEKVAEDRTRFMRKIERIEETVIQTRDALSAKAMVLLTEQGTGKAASGPSLIQQLTGAKTERERGEGTPWQESFIFQAGVAISVLALGVLGGWAVSKIREIPFPGHAAVSVQEYRVGAAIAPPPPSVGTAPPTSSVSSTAFEENLESINIAEQETLPPAENLTEIAPQDSFAADANTATDLTASDDIGTVNVMDEKKLAQMLEDPDQLAAELNAIEPGNDQEIIAPPAKIASVEAPPVPSDPKPDVQKETEQADAPPTRIARGEVKEETPPPVKLSSKSDLAKRMQSDPALPREVQEIERQAFAGVPEAQHDLAAIYTAGQGGVKQDYKRASFWFREAADQGIANASYNLGVLYHQGLGVKPDIKEAIKWYKQAAAQGHPEAQYNLGIAYIEGIGVGYDPAKAAENFEKAANTGIIEAAYNLGLIYENGLLGEPRPDQALRWYKIAADQGSPEAKEALVQLAKTLDIKLEDVNRIAEGVQSVKPKTAAVKAKTPAAGKAPPPVQKQSAATPPPALAPSHENQQELVAEIQERLMRIGLYPGPADGVGGALTEDAIRAYQARNDLAVDGKASKDLLSFMKVSE
jgi:hypothetical protein